jgi:hypothetical protein
MSRYERGCFGEIGRRGIGRGALEVLKAWCEVRMEGLRVLQM